MTPGRTMRRIAVGVALSLGVGAALAGVSAAAIDPIETELSRPLPVPLVWEPAERAPVLVRGGATPVIRLPADTALRLHARAGAGPISSRDVEVLWSEGGGLWAVADPISTRDGDLLFLPARSAPLVVAIGPGPTAPAPGTPPALFLGRRSLLPTVAPYRRAWSLGGAGISVRRDGSPRRQIAWRLAPDRPPAVLDLAGPARLALTVRLAYDLGVRRWNRPLRLAISRNGRPWRLIDLDTAPSTRELMTLDGRVSHLGRAETVPLLLPPGDHRLAFSVATPALVRLAGQDDPDYLFPGLNAPHPSADQIRDRLLGAPLPPAPHRTPPDALAGLLAAAERASPAALAGLAHRLAWDAAVPDGGTIATALLERRVIDRPDAPEIAVAAARLSGAQTFWQPLEPVTLPPGTERRVVAAVTDRLRPPDEPPRAMTVQTSQARELAGFADRLVLHRLPAGADHGLVFRLPPRVAATTLRLLVPAAETDRDAELRVRFDDAAPIRLVTRPPVPLPADAVRPDLARVGRALSQPDQLAPPVVPVAALEVPLPAAVRRVEVRAAPSAAEALPLLAVDLRVARPPRLDEEALLTRLDAVGPTAAADLMRESLAAARACPAPRVPWSCAPPAMTRAWDAPELAAEPAAAAALDLFNDWVPILRLVKRRRQALLGDIAPVPALGRGQALGRPVPPDAPTAPTASALAARAETLQAAGHPLAALAVWQAVAARPEARRSALKARVWHGRVAALTARGELFLAERQLRALALFDPDPELRDWAADELDRRLAARGNTALRLGLAVDRAVRRGAPEDFEQLVTALIRDGHPDAALRLGLVLPATARPTAALAPIAAGARWFAALDRLVGPAAAAAGPWAGLADVDRGDPDQAVAAWRAAGAAAAPWLDQWQRGRALARRLCAAGLAERRAAVAAWPVWQARHPGPRAWSAADHLVEAHAGACRVEAVARALSFSMFRATPTRPVRLRVAGPVRLRLTARPLFAPAPAGPPHDDWLVIAINGVRRREPITGAVPSEALRLIGDADRPGTAHETIVALPRGVHRLTIAAEHAPVLIAVERDDPVAPLPVLPTATPEHLRAGLAGAACATPPIPDLALTAPADARSAVAEAASRPPSQLRVIAPILWPALTTIGNQDAAAWLAAPPVAATDLPAARATAPPATPATTMAALVRRVETGRTSLEAVLPAAAALAHAHPDDHALGRLWGRLTRDGVAWEPVLTLIDSAGLWLEPTAGWQPSGPALRARAALLPPLDPETVLLTRDTAATVGRDHGVPWRLEVDLEALALPTLPPEPVVVALQIDDTSPRTVRLVPGTRRHLVAEVPAGDHTVRLSLPGVRSNRYVAARLIEVVPGPGGPTREPLVYEQERAYDVATADTPLVLAIDGPAFVQIEERRDDATLIRFAAVPAGADTLTLTPPAGRAEANYRVFQITPADPDDSRGRSVVPFAEAATAPPSPALAPPAELGTVDRRRGLLFARGGDGAWRNSLPPSAFIPGKPVVLDDRVGLDQRLGATVSLFLRGRRRTAADDEGTGDPPPPEPRPRPTAPRPPSDRDPEFSHTLEAGAQVRRFEADHDRYFFGEIFVREGLDDPVVLGLSGRVVQRFDDYDLSASLSADLFVQFDDGPGALPVHARLNGRLARGWDIAPKTRLVLAGGGFLRALSLDGRSASGRRLDPDVFSGFKDNHRAGLFLDGTFIWRPWLDTEFEVSARLDTNERPSSPDRAGITVGVSQLIGPVVVGARYRARRFFADNDRDRGVWRTDLRLAAETELWRDDGGRLDLGVATRYRIEQNEWTGVVSLTWHLPTGGRGYRDFRPGEVPFREIREQRMPAEAWSDAVIADAH